MVDSIAVALGAGSGIDIKSLVGSLVENQFSAKTSQITKRDETLTTQISAISELKSGITNFAAALTNLVKGGSLATAPTSGNSGIVTVSALPGAKLAGLATTIEVRAMAAAQVAATDTALAPATRIGTGSLKLQFGSTDAQGVFQPDAIDIPAIVIGDGDATLAGIAAKINAAGAGVTATVITDAGGERLVMKGATGAAKAFTLTATEAEGDAGLAALNVGAGATGTTIASSAGDARIAVDGVEVRRSTNSVTDLVAGVRIDLQSVAIGTPVTIGSTPATENLRQAVNDFVLAHNELTTILKTATDPINGPLARDTAALDMARSLRKLTLVDLTGAGDGSPRTLAEIGVATNRDGSLRVDATALSRALTNAPKAVEAMFADGAGASANGLAGALNSMALGLTSSITGLGASVLRYSRAKTSLTDEQVKVTEQQEMLRARLTQQYASMDARVAVYKSTQAFLTQQVDAWNGSNS